MKAVDFPERNFELAKDQPEYQMLPVQLVHEDIEAINKDGQKYSKQIIWSMACCFELSDEEINRIIDTKKIWYRQMLFGGKFQPVQMSVLKEDCIAITT